MVNRPLAVLVLQLRVPFTSGRGFDRPFGCLLFHSCSLYPKEDGGRKAGLGFEIKILVQGSCRLPCFAVLRRGVKSPARTA